MLCSSLTSLTVIPKEKKRFLIPHATRFLCNAAAAPASRELESLRGEPNLALAVTACLINAYKEGGSNSSAGGGAAGSGGGLTSAASKDALNNLKEDLKLLTKSSSDQSFLFAAHYFWHNNKAKQAKHCIDKIIEKDKVGAAAGGEAKQDAASSDVDMIQALTLHGPLTLSFLRVTFHLACILVISHAHTFHICRFRLFFLKPVSFSHHFLQVGSACALATCVWSARACSPLTRPSRSRSKRAR